MSRKKIYVDRRTVLKGAATGAAATLFAPNIVTAQSKKIVSACPRSYRGVSLNSAPHPATR